MAKLVSKTYAGALFAVAREEGLTDRLYDEAVSVKEIWESQEDLQTLMADPQIIKEQKKEILDHVFGSSVSAQLMGLLMIAAEKERLKDVPAILAEFIGLVRDERGIGSALVTSAVELKPEQKQKIEQRLKETTGFTTVETSYEVDPSLIGGVRIRVGDRILDGSLQTQLANMTRELKQIVL